MIRNERYRFHPLVPAEECSGKAQQGLLALRDILEEAFPPQYSLGIYHCRNVRGGTTLSHHAEGRAYDAGVREVFLGVADTDVGDPIVQALLDNAWALGLDHVIWNRQKWSAKYPEGGGYGGVNPHTDHIHVGMHWAYATSHDQNTIRRILMPEDVGQREGVDEVFERVWQEMLDSGVYSQYTDPDDEPRAEELAAFLSRIVSKVVKPMIADAVSNTGSLVGKTVTAEVKEVK